MLNGVVTLLCDNRREAGANDFLGLGDDAVAELLAGHDLVDEAHDGPRRPDALRDVPRLLEHLAVVGAFDQVGDLRKVCASAAVGSEFEWSRVEASQRALVSLNVRIERSVVSLS